ncbi:hypothetical protein PC9H_007156 [Pleurotus ostreatus]|uniref:DUF803-domain-containing protein n=1 Tax=Pleurotus ostreatus TaxID=5322 RepID=A0A8H7DRF2_PLEOS|nr:uncharacterized protein PC9H_007156 [Pleurotus ostreatus]KAF7427939.1 hypothetical protein PC9H_007156 [Pleurotus ostreatus]KAJ8695965.1 hypothetical protein PTI98_005870 [Pleurotus ostreatus]
MSSTTSPSASATSSVAAATSSSATKTLQAPANLKIVGIILAIVSGILIGSSFVLKKKGLVQSQKGQVAGEGVAYLKSAMWWTGMTMMILGEICNFAAYAFVEAIVVTPLGALSVVVCAILSSFFLHEKLSFFGWLGCILCILGSVVIALNGPREATVGQIREFMKLFIAPGFLAYISVIFAASLVLIFYFAPKYGRKSMLWYIMICSMIGGISVSVTTGLGAAIVQTAMGDNQFNFWFMYFLAGFVIATLLTEVYYLNVALALFNTAMVTPTYYVIFTFFSMVTTVVLYRGLHAGASQIITIVMGFLVICVGITILQMSKVDPEQLGKLDRKSTILLQAARQRTETDEKSIAGQEDPGIDALRGSFGTVGSIIRARSARRLSQSSRRTSTPGFAAGSTAYDIEASHAFPDRIVVQSPTAEREALAGMTRHQLYDAPVPRPTSSALSPPGSPSAIGKRPTIKFDSQDVVHQYSRPGTGDNSVIHQHREAPHSPLGNAYPPSPQPLGINPDSTSAAAAASNVDLYSDDDNDGLTLPLLSRISSEHAAHSAPPLINQRLPKRIDARDIFHSSSRAPTQLPTFPSPVDSTLSVGAAQSSRGNSSSSGKTDRGRSPRRNYPRGDKEDDRDESVGLWQPEEDDDIPPPGGGIRLVQPTSGPSSKF